MRTAVLTCCVWLGLVSAGHTQDVNLTMPPDLRANTPAAETGTRPAKPQKAKRAAAKAESQPGYQTNADIAATPRPKADEDRLSFGMKWNANNTSETSTRATSGLSETNKNHDGEAAGVGAKLGLGYKF